MELFTNKFTNSALICYQITNILLVEEYVHSAFIKDFYLNKKGKVMAIN